MQWWYYDFVCDTGLIGTLAFIPYKWWLDRDDAKIEESLIMFSILQADSSIQQFTKEMDSSLIQSSTNRVNLSNCFSIEFSVDNGKTSQKIDLNFGNVSASLQINSVVPPFSGLPLGSLSGSQRKLAFKSEWHQSPFRYVSQIPRGQLSGTLQLDQQVLQLTGQAYHEQGWFNGEPHLLHSSWYWFHFLHPQCNIFGTPEGYVYVQLNDQTLCGGMCLFSHRYTMKERKYENPHSSKILTGGHISFLCKDAEIEINLVSNTHKDLILFKSVQSEQLWSTLVVEASCNILFNQDRYNFNGKAMIESCWLAK